MGMEPPSAGLRRSGRVRPSAFPQGNGVPTVCPCFHGSPVRAGRCQGANFNTVRRRRMGRPAGAACLELRDPRQRPDPVPPRRAGRGGRHGFHRAEPQRHTLGTEDAGQRGVRGGSHSCRSQPRPGDVSSACGQPAERVCPGHGLVLASTSVSPHSCCLRPK